MIDKRNESGQIAQAYDMDMMFILAEEYSIKRNAREISEREAIPLQTLYYYFRKFDKQKPRRTRMLNEDYFKTINTQEKAYLLGFIAADGCVSITSKTNPRPNRLQVNISNKDRVVLELLKNELECDYEIKDYIPHESTFSDNMMSSLIINSIKLCDDLAKYGIVENKTGFEKLPKLPEKMYRHFIRGFLDGDGYITTAGTNSSVTVIGFVSNQIMLEQLKEKLFSTLELTSVATITPDSRGKKVCYMEFSTKNDIKLLKDYLYKDARFYLQRKHSKLTY